MDIDALINKYFEGETTLDEERKLRGYFKQNNLPEHLKELAPIFTFLEDEQTALKALKEIEEEAPLRIEKETKRRLLTKKLSIISIAAACIIAAFFIFPHEKHSSTNENYVWINGVKVTDITEVRMLAEISLENVSTSKDIFLEQMNSIFEFEENIGE